MTYPIRKSGLVNIVAFAQAPDWVEEGWSVRAEPEELVKAFDGYCDDVQALINAIPDNTLFRWGLFSREPLDTLVTNNVALIGDAAHPMLPWFGQGASSTIEDSVLLARCILDSKDISTAFRRYNNARFERVTFLQKESNAGTERMQGFDPYVLRDAQESRGLGDVYKRQVPALDSFWRKVTLSNLALLSRRKAVEISLLSKIHRARRTLSSIVDDAPCPNQGNMG